MALTQEDLGQIGETVTHAIHGAVGGLATKDQLEVVVSGLSTKGELQVAVSGLATRDELQVAVSGLATKDDLETGIASVRGEIRRVRSMLEEDYFAEADRVTRISRRLDRTRAELKHHIENTVHPDARSQG